MQNPFEDDSTIAAISTPIGEGGIGIVRISGQDSYAIAKKIFSPKHKGKNYPQSHRLYYGFIVDENHEIVDEVLVSFMKAPATYTREDVVEINCHSGILMLRVILEMVLKSGARMANAGEFTQRAFINGRIDLSQAENILNLVTARSEKAIKSAAKSLTGELSSKINALREQMISIIAFIEASLDFPEDIEDVNDEEMEKIVKELIQIQREIEHLHKNAEKGNIFQYGLKVSIVGKPNVGKSSLLNSLINKQRSIVTEIPGTTRDLLEEQINIEGVPVVFVDTAGIRKTEEPVESIGVEYSKGAIEDSDLVLFLIDAFTGIEEEDKEIMNFILKSQKDYLILVNKIDLKDWKEEHKYMEGVDSKRIVKISVKEKKGIEAIEKSIVSMVEGGTTTGREDSMILNVRHKEALKEAQKHLNEALLNVETNPIDLITSDLKMAEEKLGEITGSYVSKDILEHIFSNFCIGK